MRVKDLDQPRYYPVLNDSGEIVPPYAVMRIYSTETRAGRTRCIIRKPNTDFQRLYLVNGPQRIGIDKTGSGHFDIAYALCESSVSPLLTQSWGAVVDSWKLRAHRPGFFLLGNYQGDGDAQRAIVRPQEVLEVWGTLDGSLSQGGSATMSVFFRDGGSWTDSTMNITVYDRLLKSGATAISSGKWVVASWYGDRWWASSAECN